MKKLSKAILITLAVVLALSVAAVFGVNLYVQSPGVQERIQEEVSRALRVPLQITNTSVSPWGNVRITGITIPNGGTNLLEAAAFNARYHVLPVFTGRLIIYDMNVESPKIVWPQNSEGKWELPKPGEAAEKSAAAGPVTPTTPAPAAPAAEPNAPKPVETPKKERGFQVTVEGFEIKHGSVDLLDQAKQPIATFADVNMHYTTLTPQLVEGTATIGHLVWNQTLAFDNVQTPFHYAADALDLAQLTATLGGGAVSGSFHLKPNERKPPFTLGLKFDKVDLAKVGAGAGWEEGQASGTLDGELAMQGDFSRFSRADGTAKLALHDGHFRQFSYFEMIGQALQVKQLSDLKLKDSVAEARIGEDRFYIDKLTLDAADLLLSAKGTARMDGRLQLDARLSAQNALIQQLPGLVRDNFLPGEGDTHYIDFKVTGKVTKPKTDLLDKIVGQKLETQFNDLVSGLFGGKRAPEEKKNDANSKAEKKKKKKDDAAAKMDAVKPDATVSPDGASAPATPQ